MRQDSELEPCRGKNVWCCNELLQDKAADDENNAQLHQIEIDAFHSFVQ